MIRPEDRHIEISLGGELVDWPAARLWHTKARTAQRILRREKAEQEAIESGRAAYGEARLAAQARRLMRRLAMKGERDAVARRQERPVPVEQAVGRHQG